MVKRGRENSATAVRKKQGGNQLLPFFQQKGGEGHHGGLIFDTRRKAGARGKEEGHSLGEKGGKGKKNLELLAAGRMLCHGRWTI